MLKADNLPRLCAVVKKSGGLNLLEPRRPVQVCNGTALPFTLGHKNWQILELKTIVYIYIYIYIYIYMTNILDRRTKRQRSLANFAGQCWSWRLSNRATFVAAAFGLPNNPGVW